MQNKKKLVIRIIASILVVASFFWLISVSTAKKPVIEDSNDYMVQRELELNDFPVLDPEEEITIMIEFDGEDLEKEKSDLYKSIGKEKLKKEYKYVDAIAVRDKRKKIKDIKKIDGVKNAREEVIYTTSVSHAAINTEDVWPLQDGSGNNITGTGIRVSVLDSGCAYNRSGLGACTPENFTSGVCPPWEYGWDFINDDNDPYDDYGHGTAVASVIGSQSSTLKYRGVAPNVTMLCYKVCNTAGQCPESDLISAIENSTDLDVDVIQMSLGAKSYVDTELLTPSLLNAFNNDTIIVAAAGNSKDDWPYTTEQTMECPACLDFVIGVGAGTTTGSSMGSFSSMGYAWYSNLTVATLKPDIFAHGINVNMIVPKESCTLCDASGLAFYSGTSFSSPYISGIIALVKQANPTWTRDEVIGAVITNTVNKHHEPIDQGSGFPDALAAVNATAYLKPNNWVTRNTNLSVITFEDEIVFNFTSLWDDNMTYFFYVNNTIRDTNFTAELNISSIELDVDEMVKFKLNITINNSILEREDFFGYIKINSTNTSNTLYAPFAIYTALSNDSCPTLSNQTYTVNTGGTHNWGTCYFPDIYGEEYIDLNVSNTKYDFKGTSIKGIVRDRNGYGVKVFDGIANITIENISVSTIDNCLIGGYSSVDNVNITVKDSSFSYCEEWFLSTANNVLLENNNFLEGDNGIQIGGDNLVIRDNNFTSSDSWVVRLLGGVTAHYTNFSLSGNSFHDCAHIVEWISYDNSEFKDSVITDTLSLGYLFNGINITFSNLTQTGNKDGFGFGLFAQNIPFHGLDNITIRDVNLNVSEWGINSYDINMTVYNSNITASNITVFSGGSAVIDLINSSWNESVDLSGSSKVRFNWYADFNVTNASFDGLPSSTLNVSVNDSGSWVEYSSWITDGNGYYSLAYLPQYFYNSTGRIDQSVRVNASSSGYNSNITIYNSITDNDYYQYTLGNVSAPESPSAEEELDTLNYSNVRPFVELGKFIVFD